MAPTSQRSDTMPWRGSTWLPLAICASLEACSGNHHLLSEKNRDASASLDVTVADARGDETASTRPPSDAIDVIDAPRDEMGEREPSEPPGRWSLTFTNGLADATAAIFCLVPVMGDREIPSQAFLVGGAPLPFGKSVVVAGLPGIDLATTDVHPYAVAGHIAKTLDGGVDCAASLLLGGDGAPGDDGGRTRVVVSLPAIPARTLAEGRSYLAVATGCAWPWPYAETDGGDAATDRDGDGAGASDAGQTDTGRLDTEGDGDGPNGDAARDDASDATSSADAPGDVFRPPPRAAVCGAPDTGAGLVLVRMSTRSVGARFGFQIVHASAAIAAARVSLERPGGSAPTFSAEVAPYQIAPRDGLFAVARDDFGPTVGAASISVGSPGGAFQPSPVLLSTALGASDIDEMSLTLGDRLTLVVIGAQPGQNAGPGWNASRVAIVRNAAFAGGD